MSRIDTVFGDLDQANSEIVRLRYENESIKRGQSQVALLTEMNESYIARLRSEIALRDKAIDWCLSNSAARRQGGIVDMGTWNERWLEVPAEFAAIISKAGSEVRG